MNYDIDNEFAAFTEDELKFLELSNIHYKSDYDKTYLISNDNKLIGIIDNDATFEQLKNVVANSGNKENVAEYSEGSQTALGNFVKSIEKETGKTVDYVSLDSDNYTIVLDGETMTLPYNDDSSLNVEDVLSKVGKKTTFQASDKLNDENKVIIENYLKESLSTESNVEVKLNEDGTYSIFIDGEEYIKLNKDITLSETVKVINDKFDKGYTLSDYIKKPETYNLLNNTDQNYEVHVNEDLFNDAVVKHNIVKGEIDDVKTLYRTDMMTGELLKSYNEIVETEGNTDPVDRIDKTKELLDNITVNIEYSLKAYKNIDHNLGVIFSSIVNDIFKINSYHEDGEIKDYKSQTFDERKKTLKNLINEYENVLNDLNDELEELYPNCYGDRRTSELPPETYVVLDTLITCFTDKNGGFDTDKNFYVSGLQTFVSFSQEHDLMTKLDSYFSGKSWYESGMSELNQIMLKNLDEKCRRAAIKNGTYYSLDDKDLIKERCHIDSNGWYYIEADPNDDRIFGRDSTSKEYGYRDGKYYFNNDMAYHLYLYDKTVDKTCEDYFLSQFYVCSFYGSQELKINKPGNQHELSNLLDINEIAKDNYLRNEDQTYLKNIMGEWYKKGTKYQERNDDEEKVYSLLDYCNMRVDEFSSIMTDISLVNGSLYKYNQLQTLLPYEIEMENLNYLDYLVKDYSKIKLDGNINEDNVNYLSQEEFALYFYLKNSDSKRAKGYIKALQDTINQRKGYEEAALRIYEANKNGEDIIDILTMGKYGFEDGVDNFINGLGDFFKGIGKFFGLGDDTYGEIRTSADYRNMYMLTLLQQDNVYNDQLNQTFRDILQFEYKANVAIGNMAIPTLVSFLPNVGKYLGPTLLGLSVAGNSMRQTMLEGHSDTEALIYGLISGGSEVLLESLLGGITGLNGNPAALQSFKSFLHSMNKEAKEEFLQSYFEGVMRSIILKEPFDLSTVNSEAIDSALMALYTTGIMNGATNCAIKIAKEVITWSPSQFKSYNEFLDYINKKITDRQSWKEISKEEASKMGINLKEGEILKYNSNTNTYQKVSKDGYRFNIPSNLIGKDVESNLDNQILSIDLNQENYMVSPNTETTRMSSEEMTRIKNLINDFCIKNNYPIDDLMDRLMIEVTSGNNKLTKMLGLKVDEVSNFLYTNNYSRFKNGSNPKSVPSTNSKYVIVPFNDKMKNQLRILDGVTPTIYQKNIILSGNNVPVYFVNSNKRCDFSFFEKKINTICDDSLLIPRQVVNKVINGKGMNFIALFDDPYINEKYKTAAAYFDPGELGIVVLSSTHFAHEFMHAIDWHYRITAFYDNINSRSLVDIYKKYESELDLYDRNSSFYFKGGYTKESYLKLPHEGLADLYEAYYKNPKRMAYELPHLYAFISEFAGNLDQESDRKILKGIKKILKKYSKKES